MNNRLLRTLCFLFSISTASFAIDTTEKIKGNGNVSLELRKVMDFEELELEGIFNVVITQGDSISVKVETDENLQKYIKTVNSGNKLKITIENDENIKKFTKMNIYITVIEIEDLTMDLIGNLLIKDTLKVAQLKIKSTSVGNSEINIVTEKLILDLKGEGDIKIAGKAINVDLTDKAVGNLNAFNLKVERFVINYSGVGDININVENELSVNSTGIGVIKYKGNPKFTTKDVIGSGLLKRVK